ncbi:MAG: hypothetical protein QNK11_07680 [Legionella sp.]|nr:hypothetical protein [Legionella sp.]
MKEHYISEDTEDTKKIKEELDRLTNLVKQQEKMISLTKADIIQKETDRATAKKLRNSNKNPLKQINKQINFSKARTQLETAQKGLDNQEVALKSLNKQIDEQQSLLNQIKQENTFFLSVYDREQEELRQSELKLSQKQEKINQIKNEINISEKALFDAEENLTHLVHTKMYVCETVTFDGDRTILNQTNLKLIESEKEEEKAFITTKTEANKIGRKAWFVKLWDIIQSFISNSKSNEKKAREAFKTAQAELITNLDQDVKIARQAIIKHKANSSTLKEQLAPLSSELNTTQEKIIRYKQRLNPSRLMTKEVLIKQCEAFSQDKIKPLLLNFLDTPNKSKLKNLQAFLKTETGKNALANPELIQVLSNISKLYSELEPLLPKNTFLMIDKQSMLEQLSQEIDVLKTKEKEVKKQINTNKHLIDYEVNITQNTTALTNAHRILFILKKQTDDPEALEISIKKTETKIKYITENLPEDIAKPIHIFFKELKKYDVNHIFLFNHYQLASDDFYRILNKYSREPLEAPLTFKQLERFQEQAGKENTEKAYQEIANLPQLKKAQSLRLKNDGKIMKIADAMAENERHEYKRIKSEIIKAFNAFEKEIEKQPEPQKTEALKIYETLQETYLPSENIIKDKEAWAKVYTRLREKKSIFKDYTSFSDLYCALSEMQYETNTLLEKEVPDTDIISINQSDLEEFHAYQVEHSNLNQSIAELERKKETLEDFMPNEGKKPAYFYLDSIKLLVNTCETLTTRHDNVRVALQNFLQQPTKPLLLALQTQIKADKASLTDSKLGALITQANQMYPQIQDKSQTHLATGFKAHVQGIRTEQQPNLNQDFTKK